MATSTLDATVTVHDTFPIDGTDYIEFYVGNAKQASLYYRAAFGFQFVAYCGPETGCPDRASYLLQQGEIRFVFTTAIRADISDDAKRIADHVRMHGDGVRDIALRVDDARDAFAKAVERGAEPVQKPAVLKDDDGEIVIGSFKIYGDTIHSLVERKNYTGVFMPGYHAAQPHYAPPHVGFTHVDHCVGNVELGKMNDWVEFYSHVMGFRNLLSFDDKTISTEYSSLMSKVMANGNDRIRFPINEPAKGKQKSQIDEYLDAYKGPGVQHIALVTDDIIRTVTTLRDRGVEFLTVPTTYYDELEGRLGKIDEDVKSLADLGILVDRDPDGYLLQIFTKPVQDRPTLFYEIIQRKGAKSFGVGNFKALFEAIEREQGLRGNL
jgi:4-hydroxyphenylpyruvate dioxygenase